MPLVNLAIDASRMLARARTGTENYSVEIIRALLCLDDIPPVTLYTRRGQEFVDIEGAHVKESGPARLWTHVGLSRAMLRDRPQALFVPSHVVPFAHPRASIVTVHDLGYLREPDAHPRKQRIMLDRTTRWNARVAARIVAISGQTRDDLVEHYRVAPERVTVIHHGVDRRRFHPQRQQEIERVKAAYGIRTPYLLYVSTVHPRKNMDRLLDAFRALNEANLTLMVAGKTGWLGEPIEKRIREEAASGGVIRVGHVADEDLPALYSGADAFVLPSLFEGFGMGIVEAMACGTPVVTSQHGSTQEVAGDAAQLVDPMSIGSIRSGIQRALEPQRAAELQTMGLARAKQFSWTRAAQQTLDVIEEAADEA